MPTWAWIVIGVGAAVVLVAVIAAALAARRRARTQQLQERFGPEYERALDSREDRKDAEAELQERMERREQLDIRPLTPVARERYLTSWREIQAQFVDSPQAAIEGADALIMSVMRERGYPVEDFEQRAADISVDHPRVVDNYRTAHDIAGRSSRDEASTEDLRQAMQHYRALFEDMLETSSDEPMSRDRERDYDDDRVATRRNEVRR